MKKYKIVLTKKGKTIFKGGNIKPMSKPIINFEAENLKKATKVFDKLSLDYSLMNWGYYELIEQM